MKKAVISGGNAAALMAVTATSDVPVEDQIAAMRTGKIVEAAPDGIPDRVSIEPGNPYYWPGYKNLGVKVDGEIRRADVVEFCVSEGWAKVHVKDKLGRKQADPDRPGFLLNTRIQGKIEPYWIDRNQKKADTGDAARLAAAEAKRQRKADRLRRESEAAVAAEKARWGLDSNELHYEPKMEQANGM